MPCTKMMAPRATGRLAPHKGFPAKISPLVWQPGMENLPHGSLQVVKAATGGAVPPQVQEMLSSQNYSEMSFVCFAKMVHTMDIASMNVMRMAALVASTLAAYQSWVAP
ncbi:hypothetical protein BDR06DRAFT_967452 [Suillus hirtellus]|nr:hypothetical protein BDR06DRAFT_967452 [Suillus hirtellus]